MKALIIIFAIIPSFSFALENCQKEISKSETLYYEINKIILSPKSIDGNINLVFYQDLISKNKFNESKNEIETYEYIITESGMKESKIFGGLISYTSYTNNNHKYENILVDHKAENLDEKKKELSDLINQAVSYVTIEDNNILIVQTKDGKTAAIDFRLPMSANPVGLTTKDSNKILAYVISNFGVPFTPESNKTIVEAFEHNQYQIEECDEKVYTSVTTKEKSVLGIPFTISEYKHVDETKNSSK